MTAGSGKWSLVRVGMAIVLGLFTAFVALAIGVYLKSAVVHSHSRGFTPLPCLASLQRAVLLGQIAAQEGAGDMEKVRETVFEVLRQPSQYCPLSSYSHIELCPDLSAWKRPFEDAPFVLLIADRPDADGVVAVVFSNTAFQDYHKEARPSWGPVVPEKR